MKIAFYNYYHNGDLFVSRQYIKQIRETLGNDVEYHYYHMNKEKTTRDIAEYKGKCTDKCLYKERFIVDNDTLYVNTWVGIYHESNHKNPPFLFEGGINYVILTRIWKHIFNVMNTVISCDLKIKDNLEDYIATIDYSKYDLSVIEKFVSTNSRKKILFSNGPVHSGQSFNNDMMPMINDFARDYPQYDFICTKRIASDSNNIYFTDDFQIPDGDLVEIGYLSRYCDLIVGKNSGPFIYCLEKENFTNPHKKIVQFNSHEQDSLHYGLNMKSDFTFSNTFEESNIRNIIKSKIESIA